MIGEIVGNFRIVSEIGQGGMGTLYLAEHISAGTKFAVRHLAPQLAQNRKYRDLLIRGAEALVKLKHDNIVRTYELVEKETDIFLVMEYVDGQTLDDVIRNQAPMPEKDALSLCKDILKALNYAHSKRVIHRDIRPSSIILGKDGRAKIMDFGLVIMAGGARWTKTGKATGASRYMSPEQVAGAKLLDQRSDIYSMGVIIYEMLTGKVPFDGETDSEIHEKHAKEAPPHMQSIIKKIPPTLNEIVLKALEKKPEDRYPACVEFLKFIQAHETGDFEKLKKEGAEDGDDVREPEDALEAAGSPKGKINRRTMLLAGLGGLVIILLGVFITMHVMESRRLKAEYEGVMAKVGNAHKLEMKNKLLKLYVSSHEKNKHTKNAERKIQEIRDLIEERDYKIAVQHSDILQLSKNYEKAEAAYTQYLKKYPRSIYAGRIEKKISALRGLMEERDYARLNALKKADYSTRIETYSSYLESYPKGKNRGSVEKLVSDIGEEYYGYLKDEIGLCDRQEDWGKCIRLCNHFIGNVKNSSHLDEVKALRTDLRKKVTEKTDLAGLRHQAQLKGKNNRAAKEIYRKHLKANPDATTYLKKKIHAELLSLDKKSEWEKLFSYGSDRQNHLAERIGRVKTYLGKNPSGKYTGDAKNLLKQLNREKKGALHDRRLAELREKREQEKRKWDEIDTATSARKINVFERIRMMEDYIHKNASGRYISDAKPKLKRLKAEGREWTRLEGIRKKLSVQINKSGGVYIDKGNGTVQDKRTGLIWCILDSTDAQKKCLDYKSAVKYVNGLETGGFQDWRLPTPRELAVIYKNEPFFPSTGERWYWTSKTSGKASWQKVYTVNSKKDRKFTTDFVTIKRCGAVRAVRP